MESRLIEFVKDAIGIPFIENGRDEKVGWDCWGLVVAGFKKVGIDLSTYEHIESYDAATASREIDTQTKQWKSISVGEEREWDVIHLRPAHLGIVVEPGRMLHVMAATETCICSYKSSLWKNKVLGIYRHVKLS